MKYLCILITCFSLHLIPYGLGTIGFYLLGSDSWFYVANAAWSTLIVYVILTIQKSKLTFIIAAIEISGLFVNFFTVFNGLTYDQLLYREYDMISSGLILIELLVLLYWIPWRGIYNGHKGYISPDYHWITNNLHNFKTNITYIGEEKKKCMH